MENNLENIKEQAEETEQEAPKVKAEAVTDFEQMLSDQKDEVEAFLNDTQSARELSERDRDYVDHKQWTEDEIRTLKNRNQAPIVVNRCKPKVQGLKGLVSLRKSDPKGYPRTKKHEKASEAVTDGLRYVADNNDYNDTVKLEMADDFFVEGYCGAIVDFKKSGKEKEIRVAHLPWDRIYFDPHSRKKDFSDAQYMGFQVWMDVKNILKMFKGITEDDICNTTSEDDTFSDRPKWQENNKGRKRARIAYHFYRIDEQKWGMSIFTETMYLLKPRDSIYLDEFGIPTNPMELAHAYMDRENNRYGEVRSYIDQQDEINHRRSKGLHLLSTRQTAGRKGAIKDIDVLKRELAKPNGHVEYEGVKGEFEVLATGDMAAAQFNLYQDAKNELDAVSFNAQMSGERQGDLSGVAINKLQQAGTTEVNDLFVTLSNLDKRIYRQIWSRIKQSWTAEKWVRVTDDEKQLKWVGFNVSETMKDHLEEIINDASQPQMLRIGAAAKYQQLMQAQSPELEQMIQTKNPIAELDMDIILDVSFDTVNVQQEQFEMLAKFAQGSDIDIVDLIELSQLRNKKELIEKIEARRKAASEAQGGAAKLQADSIQVKNAKTLEETKKIATETAQTDIENKLMIAGGTPAKSSMSISA